MNDSNKMGTLFLVSTPIGNLEDMSFRAVRILKEADFLFCEDTRRTSILLNHYKIERPGKPESFHDHSPRNIIQKIKTLLEQGRNVAYVTDGGMPVVSDPGFVLVRAAHGCGAPVTVVPGPSAGVLLFAASGLPSPKYLFHGFFPRTRGEVEKTLEVVRATPIVHLFYEAPNRIVNSVEILNRQLPENEIVLGRELTKLHEEVLRGKASEVFENLSARGQIRGECVLAVMGGVVSSKKALAAKAEADAAALAGDPSIEVVVELTDEQKAEIAALVKDGISSKDAAKQLSKKFGVARRVIYEFIIRHLT